MKFCIPYTIGRGYSSLPPRKAMHTRFKKSGKEKLILLILSDHDPEGWDIAETFAKSMRDDFLEGHLLLRLRCSSNSTAQAAHRFLAVVPTVPPRVLTPRG